MRKPIKIELTLLDIYIVMGQLHFDFFSDKIVLPSSFPVSFELFKLNLTIYLTHLLFLLLHVSLDTISMHTIKR